MSNVLMAMLAFAIIGTCARSDRVQGVGCVLTIVFGVVAATIWIVGVLIGLGA